MKESSWFECINNNICIRISADHLRAKSLIETAKEQIIRLGKFIDELDCIIKKMI